MSKVWLSGGRHVYMSKPLMQLELYHQVITFFNEYTLLNAEVKLVISDTLIEGASCWIHLLQMLYVQMNAVYLSAVFFTVFWGKAQAVKHTKGRSESSVFQFAVPSKREWEPHCSYWVYAARSQNSFHRIYRKIRKDGMSRGKEKRQRQL